tara:strand:+ start:31 stop:894 length:864 start_codon:yes stop_codon:yes gene_type:complete
MARVRQFAKDMGLSYNKAKNLVNKGRKLRDGGSSVLESTMNKVKPVKAKNGKFKNPGKAMTGQFKNIQNLAATGKLDRKKALKMIKELVRKNPMKEMNTGGGFTKEEIRERAEKVGALKGAQSVRKKKKAAELKKFKPDVERMIKDEKRQYLSGFTKSGEETRPLGRPRKEPKPMVLKSRMTQHDKDMAKAKKAGDVREQKRLMNVKKSKEANIKAGMGVNPRDLSIKGGPGPRGKFLKRMKMGGSFPDLSGDGKVTKKDVLIGRGVIKKSRGGGLAIQGTQFRGVR